MIAIIDELDVAGDDVAAVRRRYLDEYAPTAVARGMTLAFDLMTPPVVLQAGQNRLTFIWTVPDLPGWWAMRLGGAADPAATGFWPTIEGCLIARRRTFHATEAAGV